MDGSNFAYTKLALRNKGVEEITQAIYAYPHLRVLDFGFNQVREVTSLEKLKFVVDINLENNLLTDVRFLMTAEAFPYLKKVNLQGNKVTALTPFNLPNLVHVNLNNNKILSLDDFEGHPKIEVLELRKNRLTSLKGLANMASLRELYLADNQLTSFQHLSSVPKLVKIHARKNKIEQLPEFP
jgi:Leucine-rich repeat (LRR) protein